MADNPITVPLPQDLPQNWTYGQTIGPQGTDVGLTEKHGYNYLMQQVNAAQQAAKELGEGFEGLEDAGAAEKVQKNLDSHIGDKDNPHGVTPSQIGAAVPSRSVDVTLLASSWSSANPPTLMVTVSGLGAAQNGTIGIAKGATQAQRKAAAAAQIGIQSQAAGSLTLVADGTKPSINIPATVILLG